MVVATPREKAPPILKHLLQLFKCGSRQQTLHALQVFLTWVTLTGFCVVFATLVVLFWTLDNHNQSDLDTVNDLGQTYAVLIGLILTVYLERSVEKRRRVKVAHETGQEAEKRANDQEAIPQSFTALVFASILIYSSVIFPLQRLATGACEDFPCHDVLKIILINVAFVSSGNLLVFLVAFNTQFVALELKESQSATPRVRQRIP
jgi:protein-S-isoprenylcysteine O-methyltransferase Ste14